MTVNKQRLVLNWVVPAPFKGSGGHADIFRIVKFLVEFGHECHLYVVMHEKDRHLYGSQELKDLVDASFGETGGIFHPWTGEVNNADATLATYWLTAYPVSKFRNAGRLYYFVQDFEPYFFPMGSEYLQAEHTYKMGLHCITLGPWLADLIRTRYGGQADHFDFAVDTSVYQPRVSANSRWRTGDAKKRIAFYARPFTPRRAYQLGIESLKIVKAEHPEVDILFYGSDRLDHMPDFPFTNLGILDESDLAELFSSCDAGLVLSLTNPSLIPYEMMACRCPVVDLRSERVASLLVDRQTALLADPRPDLIAQALLQLLRDSELRQSIVDNAFEHVGHLSWRNSALQVEAILLKGLHE